MNNKKRCTLAIFSLLLLLIIGCTNETLNDNTLKTQQGIISKKTYDEGTNDYKRVLLIPNSTSEEIADKTFEELVAIAQQKEGAFYAVTHEQYDELNEGAHVIIHWSGSQLDSDPPQRGANKIDVISHE